MEGNLLILHPKLLLDLSFSTLNHAGCKQTKAPPLLSSVQMEKRGCRLFVSRSYCAAFLVHLQIHIYYVAADQFSDFLKPLQIQYDSVETNIWSEM